MITIEATAIVREPTFSEEQAYFHMEPPARSPLLNLPSVTLLQDGDRVTVEQGERTDVASDSSPSTTPASTLLADIVVRAYRAVERYPDSARMRTSLGLALLNNSDLDAAAAVFEEVLALAPSDYLAASGLAHVRLLQDRFEEATRFYRALREMHPDDPSPVMGLANLEMRRRHPERALPLWETAVELAPEATFPRFGLGLTFLILSRHNEAIAQLRAAVRSDVRSASLHHGLGVAYLLAGQHHRAIKEFKAALALAPQMPEAVQGLASVWIEFRQFDAAERVLRAYLKSRQPDADHDAHELLAWAYVQQGRYKEAKAELYRALDAIPKVGLALSSHQARLTNNLGVCFLLLGDREEAYHRFEAAIGFKPDDLPAPYLNLARVCFETKQTVIAATVLSECAARFPQDQATLVLLAWCRELQGCYDDAIQQLQRLIHMKDAPLIAYAMLGTLFVDARHDFKAAFAIAEEARRRFGDDPHLANNIAYMHLMHGDVAAARATLAAIPDNVPDDVRITLSATRGLLRLWEGDVEGGISGYRQAEQAATRQGKSNLLGQVRQKMHLEIARAYLRQEQRDQARREVRKGLLLKENGNNLYHRDLESLSRMLEGVQGAG